METKKIWKMTFNTGGNNNVNSRASITCYNKETLEWVLQQNREKLTSYRNSQSAWPIFLTSKNKTTETDFLHRSKLWWKSPGGVIGKCSKTTSVSLSPTNSGWASSTVLGVQHQPYLNEVRLINLPQVQAEHNQRYSIKFHTKTLGTKKPNSYSTLKTRVKKRHFQKSRIDSCMNISLFIAFIRNPYCIKDQKKAVSGEFVYCSSNR